MLKLSILALLFSVAHTHPSLERPSSKRTLRIRQSGHGDSHGPKDGGGHDMGQSGAGKGSMGGMGGMGGMTGGMGSGFIDYIYNSGITGPALEYIVPIMPKMALYRKEETKAKSKEPGVKGYRLWYGPFELDSKDEKQKNPNKHPIGMDPQGTTFINRAENFPGDITILSAKTALVYEDGKRADATNGVYNHHVTFADTNKRPVALLACPSQKAKPALPISVTVASGEDNNNYQFSPIKGELDAGYHVRKGDNFFLAAELVNYTNEKKRVYAIIDLEYVDGKRKMDVTSETLQVNMCGGSIGVRPQAGQKKFSMGSSEMTIQHDGQIFGIRGHLHDGGVSVPVKINNKTVCESKAKYQSGENAAASLTGMSTCDELVPVKKGDKLTFSASYDLDLHPARQHAGGGEAEEMGVVMFSFAANDGSITSNSNSFMDSMSYVLTGGYIWDGLASMLGLGGKR